MFIFDIVLLVLAALRITRFVLIDSLGRWWFVGPALKRTRNRPKAAKYVEGLFSCPFCIGFWISLVGVVSLYLAGGPGDASVWWRAAAGVWALSYLVGHGVSKIDYDD